jgi:hypothetical protein
MADRIGKYNVQWREGIDCKFCTRWTTGGNFPHCTLMAKTYEHKAEDCTAEQNELYDWWMSPDGVQNNETVNIVNCPSYVEK